MTKTYKIMQKKIEFSFLVKNGFENLSQNEQKLVETARKATENAHAPYSHFFVGAALLLENGQILKSNNQENAAFPSCVCAEGSLFTYCGANYPHEKIIAVAIAAKKKDDTIWQKLSPCGNCRQIMLEYEQKQKQNISVILPQNDENFVILDSVRILLPFSFDADNLAN